jgi:hypothetical protein
MASVVDICNLALSVLGDSATVSSINPPEGSAQAEHCQRFYPTARDTCLEMHSWNFATKRISLAETADEPLGAWQFVYAVPSDYIRALSILPPEYANEAQTQPFIIETNASGAMVVYTNVEQATIKYISKVTDTTKFSPLFVNVLYRMLASYLAGPVLKGSEGMKVADAMFQNAMRMLITAGAKDSSARSYDAQSTHVPGWIQDYGAAGSTNLFDADGRIVR